MLPYRTVDRSAAKGTGFACALRSTIGRASARSLKYGGKLVLMLVLKLVLKLGLKLALKLGLKLVLRLGPTPKVRATASVRLRLKLGPKLS